jgi:hypothetical protein
LYSNIQQSQVQQQQQQQQPQPTQYINISKPMRPQQQQGNENADSMVMFLKAEEMSDKNYTESQIMNHVQNNRNGASIYKFK